MTFMPEHARWSVMTSNSVHDELMPNPRVTALISLAPPRRVSLLVWSIVQVVHLPVVLGRTLVVTRTRAGLVTTVVNWATMEGTALFEAQRPLGSPARCQPLQ